MLKPKTASEMATPGHTAIHGARSMYVRPEPESMAPHDGYGGGTPKPRNDSADSARMTAPSPMVARMMIVLATLGSTYRSRTRAWLQPMARAASKYAFCAMPRVAPRMMRDAPAAPSTPRARITLS